MFKRLHYPVEVILVCVRWYVAYPLSLRHLEEMIAERGVMVDHSTIHRWAIKMLPGLAAERRRRGPVGKSWRMDETYVKVGGQWKYLYRAVDKDGVTTDFLLRAKRDHAAARAFFGRAIDLHGRPENITIDKSGSNTAAIVSFQADSGLAIELRQSKYLNNIVEQDRLAIKRITRSTLGFQDFSMRTHPDRRHRDDAHDSQRPTLRHQRPSHGAGHSVLLPGFLIETGRVASFAYAALSRQNRNIF